jgi:hypothetical protein
MFCLHYRNALTLLFAKLQRAVGVLYSVALNFDIGMFMEALAVCIGRLHFRITKLHDLNADQTICMP